MNEPLQTLLDAVAARPHDHDFHALLRRIEALQPQLPRWGAALRPAHEPIRLGQEAELDFAPAPLALLDRTTFGPPRLGVRFFGLLGPNGPLPLHLTEYARERSRQRDDPTLARFLDVFHHRMLALFHRAWAQAQPVVQHDRPADDRFAAWLGASFGHAGGSVTADDRGRLHRAGLLATRSRHAEGLAKLLAGDFGVGVEIRSHVPHRLVLGRAERSRLGHARNRGGRAQAAQLGASATAGGTVHDRNCRFRIAIGPLTLAQYTAFLPGAPAWKRLGDWVRRYAGLDLLWDVQLCLARAQVPAPALRRGGMRLGITAWLGRAGRRPHGTDRADLHLSPTGSFRALARHDDRQRHHAATRGHTHG